MSGTVWPDWAIYWTLGKFLKPAATIILPKSTTFSGYFCKGVKIYHFSNEIIFGQLLLTFGNVFWSHWAWPVSWVQRRPKICAPKKMKYFDISCYVVGLLPVEIMPFGLMPVGQLSLVLTSSLWAKASIVMNWGAGTSWLDACYNESDWYVSSGGWEEDFNVPSKDWEKCNVHCTRIRA